MSSVEKYNSGVAPGISAARLNQPFHVISAVYDAVDDEIDVTIGHGRGQNGNGISDENTSDTVINITSPVISRTYYIFYNSDGTFTFSTTQKPLINTVILSSITTGNPLSTAIVPVDLRNLLPAATFPKSMYDADGDTGIEVERTADGDTINFKAFASDIANITKEGLQIGSGTRIKDSSYISNILGEIRMYAGATAPLFWELCQGQAVSRTDYSDIFAVIGTTYGVGDGSTTFNLPDMQGKYARGKDDSFALGATCDQLTKNPTTPTTFSVGNQSAEHHHAISLNTGVQSANHTHNVPTIGSSGSIYTGSPGQNISSQNSGVNSVSHTHAISGNTGNDSANHNHSVVASGGGDTETRPNSVVVNYIIYTGIEG